jgi:hypothetical protein
LQAYETIGIEKQNFELFFTKYKGIEKSSDLKNSKKKQRLFAQYFQNQVYFYRITGDNIYKTNTSEIANQFILYNQYSTIYQGKLWNIGPVRILTVGKYQVEAYLRENLRTEIDWIPGSIEVKFGKSKLETSIGIIKIINPFGYFTYYIFNVQILFLFYLYNVNRLNAYFNNIDNTIVRINGITIPIIRK